MDAITSNTLHHTGPPDTEMQLHIITRIPIYAYTVTRVHFEGDVWESYSHCRKAVGMKGNSVQMIKVLQNAHELALHALWMAPQTIFHSTMYCTARLCICNLEIILGVIPRPPSLTPGAWTQTPISA